MPDEETLDRRLRAVERSVTDGEHDVDDLRDVGALVERIESLESQVADAEDRIADLEAGTQALRGYVGNVRSVNQDVERRADAALAAVERLEDQWNGGNESPQIDHYSPVRGPEMERSRTRSSDPRGRDRSTGYDLDCPTGPDDSAGSDGSIDPDDSGNPDDSTGPDEATLVQRVRDVLG